MAETSKNKIYYNDDENSVADVLTDMKKMAESTDKAIENSKYNDAQIKKDISDAKKEQALKDAEQDNKIIELQNEKAELEKELKEAQEDFYQNSIRGQASGEYIHVEDSSNCRAKIGIGGNSEQKMRSGKNYLNTLAKYKAGEKVTVDGITYIFNEDGSITCNGTATADSVLTFSSNLQTINGSGKKIVGTITGTQVPAKLSILAYTSDWSKNTFELLSSVNKNITINMQENIDYTIFRIIAYKGTTLNNQTIYYQILDTSVNDLTYEQYGAMPSLDYLSKIETVGDNLNLLDIDKTTYDLTINLQKEGEYLKGNNVNIIRIGTFNDSRPQIEEKLKSGNYTISYEVEANSNVTILNLFLCVIYEDDTQENARSGESYSLEEGTKQKVFWTLNVQKNVKKMGIVSYLSNSCDIIVSKVKLEKGKVATPYSKYGQGSVKVTKCNKNLFDKDNITLSEKSYNLDDNGELISQGSWRVVNYIKVKPNTTYTLSGVMIPNKWTHRISEYDAQLVHTKQNQKTFDGFHTFTTSSTTKYIRFNLISGNNGFDYDLSSIQLEENKKKTTLEQHEEQSYIMPVQQEMLQGDYFDFDNEKEVHVWGKKILDGTELWNKSGNKYPTFYFSPCDISSKFAVPENAKGLCNYFKQIGSIWGQDVMAFDIANITTTHSDFRFCLGSNSTITTLEEWKNKLSEMYNSGQPLVLYLQLRTPIRQKFTDEQKAVAKELNNARTYKNVTNITTDSKAILSLDYAKDLETLLTSKESEV